MRVPMVFNLPKHADPLSNPTLPCTPLSLYPTLIPPFTGISTRIGCPQRRCESGAESLCRMVRMSIEVYVCVCVYIYVCMYLEDLKSVLSLWLVLCWGIIDMMTCTVCFITKLASPGLALQSIYPILNTVQSLSIAIMLTTPSFFYLFPHSPRNRG